MKLDARKLAAGSLYVCIGGVPWLVTGCPRLIVRRDGKLVEPVIQINHEKRTALVATGNGGKCTRRRLAEAINEARGGLVGALPLSLSGRFSPS